MFSLVSTTVTMLNSSCSSYTKIWERLACVNLVHVAFTVNISSTHFDLNQIAFARVGAGECPNQEGLVTCCSGCM